MAKTRISISLDPEDAERIRAVAAEHGLDVSAFLVMAGRKEAARLARIAESFADIDAAIVQAEAEADTLPGRPTVTSMRRSWPESRPRSRRPVPRPPRADVGPRREPGLSHLS